MKTLVCRLLIIFLVLTSFRSYGTTYYWVNSATSTWNLAANWSLMSNGAGGAGVPGMTDTVLFDGAGGNNGNCNVDIAVTISAIDINGYTGIIDLLANTFTIKDSARFTTGTVNNSTGSNWLMVDSTDFLVFNGTTFGAKVEAITDRIFLSGSTFNDSLSVMKIGANTIDQGSGGNIFNSTLELINNSPSGFNGRFEMGGGAPDTLNGDFLFGGSGPNSQIRFGRTPSGAAYMSSGNEIKVSPKGWTGAMLFLQRFTQAGSGKFTLTASPGYNSLAGITFSGGSVINAKLDVTCGRFLFNGSTFNDSVKFTRTANVNDFSNNATVFNSTLEIVNDSGGLYLSHNAAPITLNGDLILGGIGGTIFFDGAGQGNITTMTGNEIKASSDGWSGMTARLKSITQTGAGNSTFTGTGSSTLYLGPNSSFDTRLEMTMGSVLFNGATFNDSVTFIKTNNATDDSDGGNNFTSVLELINNSSFPINLANSAGDTIGGNLLIGGSGGSITFSADTNYKTFMNGTRILESGQGFTGGSVYFQKFIQSGTGRSLFDAPVGGLFVFRYDSEFDTRFDIILGRVELSGATFNDSISIETSGGTATSSGQGGNVFNGPLEIVINTNHTFRMGLSENDSIKNDLILGGSTGHILVFGSGASVETFMTGGNIKASDKGWTNCTIYFQRFKQTGTGSSTFDASPNSFIRMLDSEFATKLNATVGYMDLRNSTFNDSVTFIQKRNAGSFTNGGSTYNSYFRVVNQSPANIRLGNGSADTFNGDVVYETTSTGTIAPSWVGDNHHKGNITFNLNNAIDFGQAGGKVVLSGNNKQTIAKTGSAQTVSFNDLAVVNTNDSIVLSIPIEIDDSLILSDGIIYNTDTITFNDNAEVSTPTDTSHVNGKVRKIGNDAFTFPVGDSGLYRPISISAPSIVTDAFTTEYFKQNPGPTYDRSLTDTLMAVSACEYWILDRTNGTSSATVTLSWKNYAPGQPCSGVTDLPSLRVARWDGAQWVNEKNTGTTGDASAGTIDSRVIPTFCPITLASQPGLNPLPVEITHFDAEEIDNASVIVTWTTEVELSNHYFLIQRSTDLVNWEDVSTVRSQAYFNSGNSYAPLHYETYDFTPLFGTSYYRLKQFDLNGDPDIPVNPESVYFQGLELVNAYPNPAENAINYIVNSLEDGILDVLVYDTKGRIISKKTPKIESGINKFQLDVSAYAEGIYLLKVATSNGKHYDFKQFVVNRK